ncbi:MAG TPA: SAM-dependent chlorinase/fluorinase [Methanotrichaceae archaeon]|nr:SAM-dependent chlorinase/fluorinase [Methanotrichaceae archaeon]
MAVLTDFGISDFYVGALEGSVYTANPLVRISTITNEVKAFDIAEGSYLLSRAALTYPSGTVFIAEVDPGSSKDMRFIVLETPNGKIFVGPDNGILTGVIAEMGLAHAYQITNQTLMGNGSSFTFKGAYIYGPVAGHLSSGEVEPGDVGPEITDLKLLPMAKARLNRSEISGAIIHVDRYGNLITNIPSDLVGEAGISKGQGLNMTVGNYTIATKFVSTYSEVPLGDWLILINSNGVLEIARNMENAAKAIEASAGDAVSLNLG